MPAKKRSGIRVEGDELENAGATSHDRNDDVSSDNSDIVFHVKDNNKLATNYHVRVFSKKDHGSKYKELADMFEAANTHKKITSDMSEEDKRAAAAFNANIKHPIIEKVSAPKPTKAAEADESEDDEEEDEDEEDTEEDEDEEKDESDE